MQDTIIYDPFEILNRNDPNIDIVTVSQYFRSTTAKKILVLHFWTPEDVDFGKIVYKQLNLITDYVIVFCPEVNHGLISGIKWFDRKNTTIFLGALAKNNFFSRAKIMPWFDWLHRVTRTNQIFPSFSKVLLNSNTEKPKFFDILLGNISSIRSVLYRKLQKDIKNLDYNIITYLDKQTITQSNESEWITLDPDIKINNDVVDSLSNVMLPDNSWSTLSCLIDKVIYNQTAYTLVSETYFNTSISITKDVYFLTEKIAKPILSKRLFIVLSSQPGYLEALRELGFRTFDRVIDESYDLEPHEDTRVVLVYNQIKELMNKPQKEILNSIQDIVEHNQRHLFKITKNVRKGHNAVVQEIIKDLF